MRYFLLILLVFAGCKATPVKYEIETRIPDVWAEEPTQSVSIKASFTR